MIYTETTPKNSVNLLVIFYILSFEIIGTNSRYSTMWRLSSDRTKIIEGELDHINQQKLKNDVSLVRVSERTQLIVPTDPLFDIITNTERRGSSWVKSNEHGYCFGCDKKFTKSNKTISETNATKHRSEHELSCGKPANFTFYDNLVGVMNRANHPFTMDPEALIELLAKYKNKFGEPLDLDAIERKLKQLQKEVSIKIGNLKK